MSGSPGFLFLASPGSVWPSDSSNGTFFHSLKPAFSVGDTLLLLLLETGSLCPPDWSAALCVDQAILEIIELT